MRDALALLADGLPEGAAEVERVLAERPASPPWSWSARPSAARAR
jgi:hypothetical protein